MVYASPETISAVLTSEESSDHDRPVIMSRVTTAMEGYDGHLDFVPKNIYTQRLESKDENYQPGHYTPVEHDEFYHDHRFENDIGIRGGEDHDHGSEGEGLEDVVLAVVGEKTNWTKSIKEGDNDC